MSEQRIVIAICTFNNAPLLDRTLHSVALQEVPKYVDWYVLVVNNNSTDDTEAVVARHIERGQIPGLRVVREQRQGLVFARLRAVSATSAPWIAFVDDDCILETDWIAQAVQFIGAHPNCGALGGKVLLQWEDEPSSIALASAGSLAAQDKGDVALRLPASGITHLVGAGLIVRRSALEACGWINNRVLVGRQGSRLLAGEDTEIVLLIRSAGYELWYNPYCVLHHIIPARRMSERYLAGLSYGNGAMKPYLHGLLWHSSFLGYVASYSARLGKRVLQLALLMSRPAPSAEKRFRKAAMRQYMKGEFASFRSILAMDKVERTRWLGAATSQ